ncbi:right-handed parallel beta-helix repeat-containing protein [Pseudonocardia zijingensis]|uniref:Right handed beta helix domain-containing protein n=1 Tax=Pseudonocardia zijingensis TaxID=153376 RepID=A0ABN1P9J7_9PSEU
MTTARSGRRTSAKGIAFALVIGVGLLAGGAAAWGLARPIAGTAEPASGLAAGAYDEDVELAPPPEVPVAPSLEEAPQIAGPRSWVSRGRPSRMVTVRTTSLDVLVDGRVRSRIPFGGGALTLGELDRALPGDWLTIEDGAATLTATVVLSRGTALGIAGDTTHTLRLAGGSNSTDVASLHTGGGALKLTGLTVTSVDAATGQPLPPGAAGRPSIVASSGGRLDAADLTITELGAPPVGDDDGEPAVVFNRQSTGSIARTTLLRSSTGLALRRSDGVQVADVAIAESRGDGLVLSGDRGTALSGISVERNGGNGVLVTGESSDRPITGITTAGNGNYGIAVKNQTGPQITAVTTTADQSGGLELSGSRDVLVADFTATDQRVGVFSHVGSGGLTLERVRTSDGRWGVSLEKSTDGVEIRDSSFEGAQVAGVAIGGRRTTLDGVRVDDSTTAVRVERGAHDAVLNNLTIAGGRDGIVTKPGSEGVVITGLTASHVESDAIRTAGPGTRIVGGRITGGETGIDAEAATTITATTIDSALAGIRSSSPDLVRVSGVVIDTQEIGVNAASGSPFLLADSQVHALDSVRGEIDLAGINDLSLPPLGVISVIGIPLILLAVVLEEVHSIRQRRFNRGRNRVQMPTIGPAATP